MARVFKMTWIGTRRGWMKEYKGKKYAVLCRQLGVPETKEGSYQAANSWWESKRAELDAAVQQSMPQRKLLPMEDIAATLLGNVNAFADACSIETSMVEALRRVAVKGSLIDLRKDESGEATAKIAVTLADVCEALGREFLNRCIAQGKAIPEDVAKLLPPARVNQLQDAAKAIRGEAVAKSDKSVKAQVERWVTLQLAKVAAGKITPARADNLRIWISHFARWLGESADVAAIDAEKIQNFYLWCFQKVQAKKNCEVGWSASYAQDVFKIARGFVKWLWQGNLIELPRNLNSREFTFHNTAGKIQTWTVQEVKHVVSEAPGQLKLHLLLMLNCAMTQKDVSDLKDSEVDWIDGRITRKRSKTKDQKNVPTVNYKLWPITFELLQQYRSGQETVLLTKSGQRYVRTAIANGRLRKADNIRSNFKHLQKRLGLKKSLKLFRKTGVTLLDSHPVHGGPCAFLFLGHAPQTMKDRHYSDPSQANFDAAVKWLGTQLGYC